MKHIVANLFHWFYHSTLGNFYNTFLLLKNNTKIENKYFYHVIKHDAYTVSVESAGEEDGGSADNMHV